MLPIEWLHELVPAVHSPMHEDGSLAPAKPDAAKMAAPDGPRKIRYYRNPMGLPDISKTPKKDSMGMDYIPVYEGELDDSTTITLTPGKPLARAVSMVNLACACGERSISECSAGCGE